MLPQLIPVDFRLPAIKESLDRIYTQQQELLSQLHPQLSEDFCMTRADRLRSLIETEEENFLLLKTWVE